jgi:hypothetical protein
MPRSQPVNCVKFQQGDATDARGEGMQNRLGGEIDPKGFLGRVEEAEMDDASACPDSRRGRLTPY